MTVELRDATFSSDHTSVTNRAQGDREAGHFGRGCEGATKPLRFSSRGARGAMDITGTEVINTTTTLCKSGKKIMQSLTQSYF